MNDKYFLLIFSSAINSSSSPSSRCRSLAHRTQHGTAEHTHVRIREIYIICNIFFCRRRFVCIHRYHCEALRTLHRSSLAGSACACLPISRTSLSVNIGYHFVRFLGANGADDFVLVLPFFVMSNRCCP